MAHVRFNELQCAKIMGWTTKRNTHTHTYIERERCSTWLVAKSPISTEHVFFVMCAGVLAWGHHGDMGHP